jgi:hypothetical protein
MTMLRAFSALLLSSGMLAWAEEENAEAKTSRPEKPAIHDLGDGKFQVGQVTFLQKTREVSFQAEVNMKEGPLEYALVHENGKIHEAILITKARPFDVNIALKVLGFKESKELFPILDEDYRPTKQFPKVPKTTRNAARAEILLEWKDPEGKVQKAALNDWIIYTITGKSLPPLPWVYGGSYVHNKSFQAEASGDIVSLFTNNAALFNWGGKDGNLDDVWAPNTKRIPDVGTSVKVTFKPFIKKRTGALPKTNLLDDPQEQAFAAQREFQGQTATRDVDSFRKKELRKLSPDVPPSAALRARAPNSLFLLDAPANKTSAIRPL